jgi:hypothetical protein
LALALDELPREITLNELRYEQDRDPEIMELLATGRPGRVIDVNPYGIIVRKAPDGCEQILVPVRVLDGLPRVRAVRKSYKIVEARMAYRMIV